MPPIPSIHVRVPPLLQEFVGIKVGLPVPPCAFASAVQEGFGKRGWRPRVRGFIDPPKGTKKGIDTTLIREPCHLGCVVVVSGWVGGCPDPGAGPAHGNQKQLQTLPGIQGSRSFLKASLSFLTLVYDCFSFFSVY